MKVGDLVMTKPHLPYNRGHRSGIGIVITLWHLRPATATVMFPKRNKTYECWIPSLEVISESR
jgi:hypothetical protein